MTQKTDNKAIAESKSINEWTRKELFALPQRHWGNESARYDSLLVLSTGKKHDSGWAMMAIIGCQKGKPIEICTICSDDIEWKMPEATKFNEYKLGQYRIDCAFRSGAIHFWARKGKFRVGPGLSSIDIELLPDNSG